MRCMERNKVRFWFCLYKGTADLKDAKGYKTGEKRVVYSKPEECYGNISPATGTVQLQQFGNMEQYDKVLVMDNPDCPIDENSVLFVDCTPTYDKENRPQFDYTVKRVARSLNSVAYAINKVKVS